MGDIEESWIDRGGRRIAVDRCAGDDPLIVFVPGGGCTGLDWRPTMRALPEWRLVAYDRAGLGRSDTGSGSSPAASALSDLGSVIESGNGAGGVILVGHSLGGPLVRAFANDHPQRVRALVLVDPRPEHLNARLHGMIDRTRRAHARSLHPRLLLLLARRGLLARMAGSLPRRGPETLEPAERRRRAQLMASHRHLSTNELALADDLDARLGAVDADRTPPLWLITHDPSCGDSLPAEPKTEAERTTLETVWSELQESLVRAAPQGDLVVATGAGHLIPLERPDLVAAIIKDAIASTDCR